MLTKRIFAALLTALVLTTFDTTVIAQKLYVWCPLEQDIHPNAAMLSGVKVNLTITDERKFGKRVRSKCTSDLIADLVSVIRQTYPSANFHVSTEEGKPEKGVVGIEIKLLEYSARFTPAMWHATTEYSVKITDGRQEPQTEKSLDIPKDRSFFNLNGFSTAKHNLSKTYAEANADLLNFISETISTK